MVLLVLIYHVRPSFLLRNCMGLRSPIANKQSVEFINWSVVYEITQYVLLSENAREKVPCYGYLPLSDYNLSKITVLQILRLLIQHHQSHLLNRGSQLYPLVVYVLVSSSLVSYH